MKSVVVGFCLLFIILLFGCSKTPPTGPWAGTYINVLGPADSFSTVTITYTGSNTVDVLFKIYQFSYVYSAVTLHNVPLTGTSATFAQKQHIIEATDLGNYNIQGNLSFSVQPAGKQITLTAVATDITTNNAADTKNYQFTGLKSD